MQHPGGTSHTPPAGASSGPFWSGKKLIGNGGHRVGGGGGTEGGDTKMQSSGGVDDKPPPPLSPPTWGYERYPMRSSTAQNPLSPNCRHTRFPRPPPELVYSPPFDPLYEYAGNAVCTATGSSSHFASSRTSVSTPLPPPFLRAPERPRRFPGHVRRSTVTGWGGLEERGQRGQLGRMGDK